MRSAMCAAVLALLVSAPLPAFAQAPSVSPPSEPAACTAAPNSQACAAARACAADITSFACREGLRAQTYESAQWALDLGATQLAERVRRLRADLDTSDGCLRAPVFEMAESAPTGVFDFAASYDLYQRLVQPFASTMAGKTRVLVAPSGPLMSLPFSVLVAAPEAAGPATLATFQRAQWLGIRYALSTLPAPSSLRALRCPRRENGACAPAAGRPAARRAFVGYGDPILGGGAQPAQTECRSAPYAAGGLDQAALATLAD